MKNKILLLGLMLTCAWQTSARAQSRSTVQLHTGGDYIFGYQRANAPTQDLPTSRQGNYINATALLGIQYQYRVDKNLSAFANYMMTTNQPNFIHINRTFRFAIYQPNLNPILKENNGLFEDAEGVLTSRNNYHFFDAGLGYQYDFSSKHHLTGSFGLSYAYGKNVYLTKLYITPYASESFCIFVEESYRAEHEGYWGAVAGISYDYSFWENRLNAGADIHFRYYESDMPFFMNYGLHVGYNF